MLTWLAVGVRPVGKDRFGVLDGPLPGLPRKASRSWTMAPPGLLQLSTYPADAVELALPLAEEALLPAPDGSCFGLRGWITVRARPEAWRQVHAASHGQGLRGLLLGAVQEVGAGLAPGAPGKPIGATWAHDLELKLVAALAGRGVDLRRLDLDSIDFLASDPGTVFEAADTRLLIIGLDGADWEIIDRLLEQDRLPHLRRLIDGGVRAKLLSISPLLSPVVWTTVATGVEPTRHGILDFLVQDSAGGSRQPVTSAQRRAPTFWELLSRAGVEVGVVGWWATWPADAVRGYLVSDRIAYQLFGFRSDPTDARGKTWPPDLYGEIERLIVMPTSVGWEQVRPYLDGGRQRLEQFDPAERRLLEDFRTLLASGKSYLSIAQSLRQRHDPQLEVVYFEGTDTVGHLFMPYRPPHLPGVDPRRMESFGQMVDRYYQTADDYVGQLLAGRGEEWTVMLVSDHGFATDTTRPQSTDSRVGHGAAADWHRRFGILVLSGRGVRRGARIDESSVYDVAPTVLALFGQPVPRSWPGRVLAPALTDEFLKQHPVRYSTSDPERQELRADSFQDPAAADLLEKLRSLGYVSTGGASAESVNARNNAAVSLMAEGRFAEAERALWEAIAAGARAPMLRVNLGVCLRHLGRADEARGLFEEAMAHPGTFRLAGNQLAQLLVEANELDRAERLAQQVLAREPDAGEVHNTLGLILERRGELAVAEGEYRRAAELDPDDALARNNLGNLAKERHALEEAESWYLRAIEADPYFMGAYNNLALVYQAKGQMQMAIDLYARALGKVPDNAVVLNNLAGLHFATGDLDQARELWKRLVESEPTYASPWSNLAGVEITRGRLDEAQRLLDRALALEPDYGDARINLAIVFASRGDRPAARAELQRAARDPRSAARAWTELGSLELEDRRLTQAIEALRRALDLAPSSTKALNAIGQAHLLLGRRAEAIEAWRKSLTIDPSQEPVRRNLDLVERP